MSNNLRKSNRKTFLVIISIPTFMFFVAFASVPLYNLFCKVTGYGGTVQTTNIASDIVLDKNIKIRFNSDVVKGLNLYFQPVTRNVITKIGETKTIHYKVINKGEKKISAISTYNVTPQKAGIYFNKLDCFCYEEKEILPGNEKLLPVSFFISPEILDDPNTKELKSITLSYTFFNNEKNIN